MLPPEDDYTDDELCVYLKILLGTFVESNKIGYLVNTSTMVLWRKCFTSVSYDPNPDSNYETLESVGDKILSYVFKNLFIQKISKYSTKATQ